MSEQQTILYVEDHSLSAKVLMILFNEVGDFSITHTLTADEAIEKIEAGERFENVITDHDTKSDKTGMDLIRLLKENGQDMSRVFAYSGSSVKADAEEQGATFIDKGDLNAPIELLSAFGYDL